MTAAVLRSVGVPTYTPPVKKSMPKPKPKRAEKNRSPSPGFQFISVTDYAQVKSSHNVSLVRGHVMRQMRRQQQQSSLAGNSGEASKSGSARSSPSRSSTRSQTPQPTFSSFENSSLDRLISIEPPKKVKRLMPKNEPKEEEKNSDDESVSSTKTGSSPGPHPTPIIPMDSTAHELLQYYFSKVLPDKLTLRLPSGTNPWTATTLPFITTNATYLQSVLCIATCVRSAIDGKCVPSTLGITYRGEALRRIYEECQIPGQAATTPIIMAICSVMFFDVIYGDVDAFLHHMKGLDDLVAMRGGLDKFENPEVVMRCLPWCDHYRALFTNTAPKYEVQPSPYVLEFGTQEPGFRRDMFLSAQMPTIVDGIRQLTQLKLESHQRDVSPVELEHFLAQRDFLEHQLVTLHTQLLHSATWDSCVILGLILFEHLELRLMNSKYATMGHIALLLRNALLATELDTCWGSEGYPVLIWVLFMGASISEDFEDLRSWFVCTLRDVMTSTGCNSWESVNYVLQSFVWANGACDMTSIWLEVMT